MIKYTKELLEENVLKSKSLTEMLKNMGIQHRGGSMPGYIKRKIISFNINIDHWISPVNSNKKSNYVLGFSEERIRRRYLKVLMEENGIDYKCCMCNLPPIWLDKDLTLHIDHINGNNLDNRLENLRFLCPNCHTQTDTYSGKNKKKENNKCKVCEKIIRRKSIHCKECNRKASIGKKLNRKGKNLPDKGYLQELINSLPIIKIAKKLHVNSATINSWCEKLNIEKKNKKYWSAINNQNRSKIPDKEYLENLFRKFSIPEIACQLNVTYNTVKSWRDKYNII